MARIATLGKTGHKRYQTNQKHLTTTNQTFKIAYRFHKKSKNMKKWSLYQTVTTTWIK